MLADFEVEDLASGIPFCLAVLLSLKKNKELDDDELEASEEDWRDNLNAFCRGFLRSNS